MKLKIKDITSFLEGMAPLSSQESYDNSGLIVGNHDMEVTQVLLSLDCIEETVEEAISIGANLIIAHHPIVFGGLKQLNGKNYVERTVIKAIKNDIAIYSIHTNLDNYKLGVNYEIAKRIGIENPKVLAPKKNVLKKLVFFCPEDHVDAVTDAVFNAGGGNIGEYSECSFTSSGEGTFLPSENANPTVGTKGNRETAKEKRIEVLISSHKESQIVRAMMAAHPYEEVAHDIYTLSNYNQDEGAGMIGELSSAMETTQFLSHLKKEFNCGAIRHTALIKDKIKTVAFCGGSGSFLLGNAKSQQADIYITGDFKYHEFFDAEKAIIIADIGHFESEQYTPHLILALLKKNFINFAFHLSKVNTNPINYF
ncbi:Nif3-like dinuclear metal center hexameric protein [Brumimicrobium aurantiacum]|uniref:GTP cyclohydrolase 1 type 2 homolog n=1 Tax=Brumimicrobium aurantiacum TaxID=1737063 RepID=A0A3E1EWQ2_9FLAO|nr:Nif3-like dinuclear metal center hexameric protein [Brumimicrobium aurantiacum]RFC53977.1 Nif3-like dinuclear metal center hexameric protein [Brumimicrobium aurantiacum]